MCRLNPKYDVMVDNPICLQIPWKEDDAQLEKWKKGQTGYPFIDAGQRQLLQEGWTHHTVRNAAAMFLTRGDLRISWEKGCNIFMTIWWTATGLLMPGTGCGSPVRRLSVFLIAPFVSIL